MFENEIVERMKMEKMNGLKKSGEDENVERIC
jgi:hypothetical protein